MKKAVVSLVAAALLAGTVATAPSALAGPGDPVGCLQSVPGTPEQYIVTINGLDITINPNGVPTDPAALGAFIEWALSYASCVERQTVTGPLFCRTGLFLSRYPYVGNEDNDGYVSISPGGAITFHGSRVAEDATACL